MPDDLLTEEELLALEEELLAAEQPAVEAPVGEPPRFTPMAPRILPPGPSPEFLRRSREMEPELPGAPYRWGRGAISSFDPTTGVRREFQAISPPRSASADYLEQLRNQINNTQYATQAAAQDAANQFQAMREFIRLKEEGLPEHEAFYRSNPLGKPGSAALINALKPIPQATMRDLGGGVRVVEGGRNTRLVPQPRPEPKPRPIQPRVVVGADEFGEPKVTWSGSPEDFAKQFPGATLKGPAAESPTPASTSTNQPVVKTQKEFDALPKGSIYIGKDGKRYRKP